MSRVAGPCVLLDVGSTNSRAWLVVHGEVVRRCTAAVGVRDSARDGSTVRVRAAIRTLVADVTAGTGPAAVIAAGMITSSLGLAEVPHVPAPASVGDLASAAVHVSAPDVCEPPILLVPGVWTADADRPGVAADVMRGEETLAVGLGVLGRLDAGGALLNASSHWKLIRIDRDGRVAGSRTSLGGEVVHAVQTSTLLAASLPDGPLTSFDSAWLERGAASARREGLLRALFRIRLLEQQCQAAPEERLAWLVGACIAEDLDALAAQGAVAAGCRLLVSGPADVPRAWVHLLRTAGVEATALDAGTLERGFVAGLLAIADAYYRRSEGTVAIGSDDRG